MGTLLSIMKPRRTNFLLEILAKEKEKKGYMLDNGGMLLEELLHSCDGKYNPFRIFSAEELAKATNNYSEPFDNNGRCRMYRGSFNGRRIYVKSFYPDELEIAINEIVFASQVNNHNNILMLLGCCLETKIPVLVYEDAENGVLTYQPLLPWDCRLKIAKEIADALAYLHTGLSMPIIHGNVKPTNIYLDGNNVAKLSDFSLSVSIPPGEEYVKTKWIGSIRYVAPECIETGQFTEKCDVYSFGSLFFEILSGVRALTLFERYRYAYMTPSESSLAIDFDKVNLIDLIHKSNQFIGGFSLVKGVWDASNQLETHLISTNDLLEVHHSDQDIYSSNVDTNSTTTGLRKECIHQAASMEATTETQWKQLMACTELALKCYNDNPGERPTMKEVAQELRRIITLKLE